MGAPVTAPLTLTSTFVSSGEPDPSRSYGRNGNPTWEALEQGLGALENAEAVVFASGQAASLALMLCLAKGRRILLPNEGYYNTHALAQRLRPFCAEPRRVDHLDLAAVERELTATTILWAETPSNPLLQVSDLTRLGQLAAAATTPMVVDNTVATGMLQHPLEFGALASLISLTKSHRVTRTSCSARWSLATNTYWASSAAGGRSVAGYLVRSKVGWRCVA